jgi:DNA-binding NtrC family response regulator
MLERHGYRTVCAESGEQAIDIVQRGQETIDMVVLDINMPGMGGQKCLEKLLEIAPTIKVIISTGYLSDGLTKKTMETGAVNFIAKPYRLEELLDKVREVLDQH